MGIYESFNTNMMEAFASQDYPDPTENPSFMSWFGNSQVVDSSGNPIPVFHGSEAEFRAFDYNFIGDGHDVEGPGFYFTNVKEEAAHYTHGQEGGKIYEVFLKIENPVPLEGKVSRDEIEKLVLRSLGMDSPDELWTLEDNDAYWETKLSDWAEHPVAAFNEMVNTITTYNKGPHDAFQSVWADGFGFDRSADYLKAMLEIGYDGVILENETQHAGNNHYIVFSPKNIKAVSSTAFSEDEDIYNSESIPGIDV